MDHLEISDFVASFPADDPATRSTVEGASRSLYRAVAAMDPAALSYLKFSASRLCDFSTAVCVALKVENLTRECAEAVSLFDVKLNPTLVGRPVAVAMHMTQYVSERLNSNQTDGAHEDMSEGVVWIAAELEKQLSACNTTGLENIPQGMEAIDEFVTQLYTFVAGVLPSGNVEGAEALSALGDWWSSTATFKKSPAGTKFQPVEDKA